MLLNRKISVLYFVRLIKWQLLLIAAFALLVGFLHMHPIFNNISIPFSILALVGTVVSILLAFRTSQSYERWWEARTVWGAIVNDSRTLTREILQFMPSGQRGRAGEFAERQIVWVYALGESLRRQRFSPRVEAYLESHKVHAMNIPNALLDLHSQKVKELRGEGHLSEFAQLQLNVVIARLCDSMGKCERIKNTVFPRSYSLMLHTLIYIFTALLPFSFDHSHLAIEIVISILIPVVFITIEKTAIIMQDPFENTPVDTPMTSIAQTIEINLRQTVGDSDIPVKEDKGLYYEM